VRGILRIACVAIAVGLVLTPSVLARPNVVVLMTDDQTYASMKYMTQTNQLLGGEGTTFSRYIATFPLCCPSRTTSLTGQYSHNHGVLHNAGPFGGFASFEGSNTLPVWLQNAGYRTIQLGRYLNGYEAADGVQQGWSDWFVAPHSKAFNYVSWAVNENGTMHQYPTPDRPGEYATDYQARRAVELIEGAAPGEQPFYLSVWFTAPHRGAPRDPDDPPGIGTPSPAPRHRDAFANIPMPRPPSFDEANMRDKPQIVADRPRFTPERAAAVEENWRQENESLMAVDEAVGKVVDALRRTGELENTLIQFESDNGFMHGEHRALAEKVLPYEESIHVPLVLRGPGIPRGRVDNRLVGNIDLPATILDAAEVAPGRVQDGLSLLDMLAQPDAELGRGLLIENGNGANGIPKYRGIRTDRYLYVEHKTTGEEELYDLAKDPYELRSLDGSPAYDAVRFDLQAKLKRLQGCAGVGCHTRPGVRLLLRSDGRPLGACVRDDLKLRVSGKERAKVVRADVLLGRSRVATLRTQPLLTTVKRARFPRRGTVDLRVNAELRDGRKLTLDDSLRACGAAR
jgi:N-acetylglucosamine-6-sulfatase